MQIFMQMSAVVLKTAPDIFIEKIQDDLEN